YRNSALLKTRTYLGLLTPCLALHGSQRLLFFNQSLRFADEPLPTFFAINQISRPVIIAIATRNQIATP
ncbi:hypothetical protein, partial [Piscirickettsia salmonis]|uniref:hypothetical protein n=1 Tax=Piscirickettsia salmonis TaxID=1238 RepID=UPI00146FBEB1